MPRMEIPAGLKPYARTTRLPGSGHHLFYYDAGSFKSPAILLVHGLGDEADSWRRVLGYLARSNRVIAPDLPGFGRSPLPARHRLSPPFLAGLLLEFLESLGIEQATFVGSSLGASLVQIASIAKPERVSRLVLVDGGLLARMPLQSGLVLMLLPGIGERRYRALAHDAEAAYETLRPYYAKFDLLPAEEREFLRGRVGERVANKGQERAYFSLLRGYFSWMFRKGRLFARLSQNMGIPTLFVWGAEDRIIPVEAGQVASERHQGARLEVIAGAGHLPHQEAPQEFLRAIMA